MAICKHALNKTVGVCRKLYKNALNGTLSTALSSLTSLTQL